MASVDRNHNHDRRGRPALKGWEPVGRGAAFGRRDARPDPEPVRLVTRVSRPPRVGVGARPGPARFRVVAEMPDGRLHLLCLGVSRPDAVDAARCLLAGGHGGEGCAIPPEALGLRVQRWSGAEEAGRWVDAPRRPAEFVVGRRRRNQA